MGKPIFAKRLVERRNLKGFTQQQVADNTELSRARLNNYEQGIREPDIETTIKLASFFGCTTDYLLGKTEHPSVMTMDSINENHCKKKIEEDILPVIPQLSDDELALIEKYRRMKNHEKDTMHKVADTIAPDDEQAATFAKGC